MAAAKSAPTTPAVRRQATTTTPDGPLFAAVLGAVRELEFVVHRLSGRGPVTTTSLDAGQISSPPAVATVTAAAAAESTETEREQAAADLNLSVGWVPVVGTVFNAMNLVSDFLDFTIAALRGDPADMGDEVADMTVDVIGMIPIVGGPLAGTIQRLRVPDPAPGDHAPAPGNDTLTTDEDTPLVDNVLSNDTDADGDILTATLKKGPTHGVVSLDADGSFTYTATADYNGADVFTYTVSDGPKSKTGTVKITVNAINDAPVAVDDSANLDEDSSAVITVLSNDTDADHDPLSVVETVAPGHGAISLGANGVITYTPTADYNGTDSFDYTVTDGHGGTATATVHLTIAPVSDVSVDVTTDPATGVVSGRAVSTDPEAGPLTYSGSSTTVKGSVTVADDGAFTYVPTDSARHGAARIGATTAETTDTFTITASDGSGGTTTFTVSVPISPANTAPVIGNATAGAPNTSTGVVTGTVTATDADGDTLVYSTPSKTTMGGVVINAGTGVFTYTPTDAARHAATSWTTDTFTVTVTDSHGGATTATVTVSVAPVGASSGSTPPVLIATVPGYSDGSQTHAPMYVLPDPNGLRAYTINFMASGGVSVSVLDTVTNQIIGQPLRTGDVASGAVLSPDGRWLYISDSLRDVVSVINTSGDTPTLDKEISVGDSPGVMVASSDGTRIYVADYLSDTDVLGNDVHAISVIDTASKSVVGDQIRIGSAYVSGIIVSPDDSRLYVSRGADGLVSIVDTDTRAVTPVRIARVFGGGVMSPDGSKIYFTDGNSTLFSTKLLVFDTASATVAAPITIAAPSGPMVISPDGKRLYLAGDYGYLAVFDTTTGSAIKIDDGDGGYAMSAALTTDGTRLFIVRGELVDGTLAKITLETFDTGSNTFLGKKQQISVTSRVGVTDVSASLSADNRRLYVANPDVRAGETETPYGTVSVVDTRLAAGNLPAPVVTTPQALISRIPRESDTIYAEKIYDPTTGKNRMVVYMSGIEGGLNESTAAAVFNNLGKLRPDVDAYINSAYQSFGGPAEDMEIELVGHSNGGQLMQLYAAEGLYKDKVTSLVVAGSPLIRTEDDFPANLHALAFVVGNDPVPFNFTNWISVNWDRNEADYKDIVWDGSQPSVLGPLAFSDYANHDIANYINLAARFDAAAQLPSAPAVDQELLADIKRFSGVRVDSMNSLQIIPDAERVAQ